MPVGLCELHENATSHVYYLLQRITTKTQKSQVKRRPIKPGLKLTITLMYKETGNCYRALCILRFALNTIAMFIPEVHQGIIDKEEDKVFLIQLTKLSYEKWNNIWQ